MKVITLLGASVLFCVHDVSASQIESFRALVKFGIWTENRADAAGRSQPHEVKGELWSVAIQTALAQHNTVHLPARSEPYYLDTPIVLKSGQSLTADPTSEIRLRPGSNTCMVRNEHVLGFREGPVPADLQPDTDILIEGGIWSTLANGVSGANGNLRGASARQDGVPGTHGVILLHNVRRVTVRNVTIRQSKAFGVHLANVREFLVEGVTLDRQERDGVHVNGPASEGVIRHVSGDSHDDPVALNAWEWENYAPTFGPIHHVTVEGVRGAPDGKRSTDAIRLLPGVKRFADGSTLDCPIHDIVLRDITDIREFKFYDQPNLEKGRDIDFSVEVGKLRDIRLQGLTFTRPGVIQIAAEVEALQVEDVRLSFTPAPAYRLIAIGPMSATYRPGPDPSRWVEIFSPDRDVTVRGLRLEKVTVNGQLVKDAQLRFISVKDQQINPNYPQTVPRGGLGKASLLP